MATIVTQPPTLSLQGRPIVFTIGAENDDQPYIRLIAEPVPGQKDILPLRVQDASAVFDLREYFKPELKVSLSLTAALHLDACKQFAISFYEYYGNPPTEQDEVVSNKTIHIGTVPKWMQAAYDALYADFGARLAANPFMTWYPAMAKRVVPTQPELLYFVQTSAGSVAVTVSVLFTDGTTASHTPGISVTPQTYEVASVPVGFAALGLAAAFPSKKVASYIVTVAGKTRQYIVDHTPYHSLRFLLFRTSLGGYDTLACTGEADEGTNITRIISESIYAPESLPRRNKKLQRSDHSETVKVNSGWLMPGEKRWLNDLMISEDVIELHNGIQTPVMILNSTLDRTERTFEPGSIEIEYERLSIVE